MALFIWGLRSKKLLQGVAEGTWTLSGISLCSCSPSMPESRQQSSSSLGQMSQTSIVWAPTPGLCVGIPSLHQQ